MKVSIPKFAIATIIASVSLTPALAQATGYSIDGKVHAGSFCQAALGHQAGDVNTWPGGSYNVSQDPRIVTCPILRDNTLNANGTESVAVNVNNPGGTIKCSLYHLDALANSILINQRSTTTTGAQTLDLDLDTSTAGGYYTLLCTLPRLGRVINYMVREFGPTDAD